MINEALQTILLNKDIWKEIYLSSANNAWPKGTFVVEFQT